MDQLPAENDSELDKKSAPALEMSEDQLLVDPRIYHMIYQQLNARTESISRVFKEDIQIGFDEIRTLKHMLDQATANYMPKSRSCAVTVFYSNDMKDDFASFDEFSKQSVGRAASVESILIEYKFLLLNQPVPNTLTPISQPKQYNVSIRLISRVAVQRRLANEKVTKLFFPLMQQTASIKVEYFDYTIAKAVLAIFDDWYKVLPCAEPNRFISKLQPFSHEFPRVARMVSTVFAIYLAASYFPTVVTEPQSVQIAVKYLLGALAGIFLVHTLSYWIGEVAYEALCNWQPISFVKINKADEKDIEQTRNENKRAVKNSAFAWLGVIVLNITSKTFAAVAVAYFVGK